MKQARQIMQPFVLRRIKEDVLTDLPPKHVHNVDCQMTRDQEMNYIELIENYNRQFKYQKKEYCYEDNDTNDSR